MRLRILCCLFGFGDDAKIISREGSRINSGRSTMATSGEVPLGNG